MPKIIKNTLKNWQLKLIKMKSLPFNLKLKTFLTYLITKQFKKSSIKMSISLMVINYPFVNERSFYSVCVNFPFFNLDVSKDQKEVSRTPSPEGRKSLQSQDE